MLRFAWRWSQIGDVVVVHDSQTSPKELVGGVVAFVERQDQVTRVGIRLTEDGVDRVVWPSRFDVHPDPFDQGERCIRCDG